MANGGNSSGDPEPVELDVPVKRAPVKCWECQKKYTMVPIDTIKSGFTILCKSCMNRAIANPKKRPEFPMEFLIPIARMHAKRSAGQRASKRVSG